MTTFDERVTARLARWRSHFEEPAPLADTSDRGPWPLLDDRLLFSSPLPPSILPTLTRIWIPPHAHARLTSNRGATLSLFGPALIDLRHHLLLWSDPNPTSTSDTPPPPARLATSLRFDSVSRLPTPAARQAAAHDHFSPMRHPHHLARATLPNAARPSDAATISAIHFIRDQPWDTFLLTAYRVARLDRPADVPAWPALDIAPSATAWDAFWFRYCSSNGSAEACPCFSTLPDLSARSLALAPACWNTSAPTPLTLEPRDQLDWTTLCESALSDATLLSASKPFAFCAGTWHAVADPAVSVSAARMSSRSSRSAASSTPSILLLILLIPLLLLLVGLLAHAWTRPFHHPPKPQATKW